MKRKIILILLLVAIIVTISIHDKDYQINSVFKNMFDMESEALKKIYGSEVAEIFYLYDIDTYDTPKVSSISYSNTESVVDITIYKYEDSEQSYGNLVDSKSAFLRFKFKRIPILNLDLLEGITPE
ncbi:hypothetical protein KHM83_19050 [Fusibacter paucivorans]|uniref:DUF3139 domain-containing protein n=1 Tax=Fusibacter paucivorans TaxID=76009 RepID=A0ABS5PUK2_9FIRM|nr:hypothetical protein [Fusibacter paucivorans]MBS7528768.1 hypothetical protein [Fusibacter paucivorans]